MGFFCNFELMKVLFLTQALTFSLIPRIYPVLGDVLTLSLRDEFTDEIITPAVTYTLDSNKLNVTITDQPIEFGSQKKYEVILTNAGSVIYLGKMIILEPGTDVQNYEYNTQTNVRFDY